MIKEREHQRNGLRYRIRVAILTDAKSLSDIRVQIDGETENLDREAGEDFLNEAEFANIIAQDQQAERNLFLVCEVNGKIIGFLRAKGNHLKRKSHQIEFGLAILKKYWGYAIGRHLLETLIDWADATGIHKISLQVIATNESAIALYKKYDFIVVGVLRDDKLLADGFRDTLVMGRIKQF
ncbi:RimJ/RimL family protein N-acetyltransferase [Alkalihalobacillus xiaoxiensis]|uniref:RimJ/RimL family protein N-acetyltransferase n=1 Tax=Shouchella xiaoxiensis TaxID=766895 RepID=A0ABS2SUG1_9BACI|nr:GNAT family N-acetyltransferase [Shouchella xiaoxiensis]MBM7839162.1 RimJ/RimL family protein N-acetyltransferase [Shouchella xiaoxiensis]